MSSQWNAQTLAKITELGIRVVETGNRKRLWIELGEEACKKKITATKRDCTCEK